MVGEKGWTEAHLGLSTVEHDEIRESLASVQHPYGHGPCLPLLPPCSCWVSKGLFLHGLSFHPWFLELWRLKTHSSYRPKSLLSVKALTCGVPAWRNSSEHFWKVLCSQVSTYKVCLYYKNFSTFTKPLSHWCKSLVCHSMYITSQKYYQKYKLNIWGGLLSSLVRQMTFFMYVSGWVFRKMQTTLTPSLFFLVEEHLWKNSSLIKESKRLWALSKIEGILL